MSIETFRLVAFARLRENGASDAAAAIISLALHPFDDGPPFPVRSLEKPVRRLSRNFVRPFGKPLKRGAQIDEQAMLRAALEALSEYRAIAIRMGDPYYSIRYDAALTRSLDD